MKKYKIVSILIILLIIICISQSTYAICDTYVSPSASKEINAIRLTLSDGTILHDIVLTKDVNKGAITTETSYKTFNLNILVDTSSSMQSKLNIVKDSLKSFVNKLYEYYGKYSSRLNIKLICFNNELNENEEQPFEISKKDKNTILNEINNIRINNTERDIKQAIEIVNENYDEWQPGTNSIRLQSLLIVTDGIADDDSDEYKQMYQQANKILYDLSNYTMVSMFNLEIEDYSMSRLVLGGVPGLRNISTMIYDFNSNLMGSNIYEDIEKRLINIETVVPVGLKGDAQMTNDTVLLYVDDELLYGATLEIEYIITYSPGTVGGSPTIVDNVDPNLSFSPDAKLLTEPNKTNRSIGWNWNSSYGKPVKTGAGGQTKIVLSTMLTVDNIPDIGYINQATVKTNVGDIPVVSMRTKIMPPFGQEDIIKDLIRVILLVVAILLVLALYKIYNRPKDDK